MLLLYMLLWVEPNIDATGTSCGYCNAVHCLSSKFRDDCGQTILWYMVEAATVDLMILSKHENNKRECYIVSWKAFDRAGYHETSCGGTVTESRAKLYKARAVLSSNWTGTFLDLVVWMIASLTSAAWGNLFAICASLLWLERSATSNTVW